MQGGGLPSEYTKLEYLQGTGTQVLNLGFVPNVTCRFEIKLNIQPGHTYLYPQINFFGSITDSSTTNNYLFCYISEHSGSPGYRNKFIIYNGYTAYEYNCIYKAISRNVDHIVKYVDNQVYLDGALQGTLTAATSMNTTNNAYLFSAGNNDGYTVNNCSEVKIYYANITQDGAPIRTLIPALRKHDSKPGMYDTVTKTFYTNQGTGEFLYPT